MRKIENSKEFDAIYEDKNGIQYGLGPVRYPYQGYVFGLMWRPNEETSDTYHLHLVNLNLFEEKVLAGEYKKL